MIINTTKKTLVATHYQRCETFWSQFFGLMFRKRPETLLFVFPTTRIIRLHMMFVFFPIDVILLDKKKRVVEVREGLQPWKTFASKTKAAYCIEGYHRIAQQAAIAVGDHLSFS